MNYVYKYDKNTGEYLKKIVYYEEKNLLNSKYITKIIPPIFNKKTQKAIVNLENVTLDFAEWQILDIENKKWYAVLNENNEIVSQEYGYNCREIELVSKLEEIYTEQGIPKYIYENEIIREKTENEIKSDDLYILWENNKIIKDADEFLNQGYKTFGKNLIGIMLIRFKEQFDSEGTMSYNNELHKSEWFNPELISNFKYLEKDLPMFNDTGFVYVDNYEQTAELIIDTGLNKNKIMLGSLSMIHEANYQYSDIEISFKRGFDETPITPIGKAPYSVFGYADLTGQTGTIKIHLKLKNGNANKRAVISNFIIVTE